MEQEKQMQAEYCRVKDVAVYLGCSTSTIGRLMKKGILPYYTIGKCNFIKIADVENLLNQNKK